MGNAPNGWLPPPYYGVGRVGANDFCYTENFANANTNFWHQFDLGRVNPFPSGSPFDDPGLEGYIHSAMPVGTTIYGILTPSLRLDFYNNFALGFPPVDMHLYVDMVTTPFNPATLTYNIALGLGFLPFGSVLIGCPVPVGSGSVEVKGISVSFLAPVVLAAPIYGFRFRCEPLVAVGPDSSGLYRSFATPPPNPSADGWAIVVG